MRVASHINLCTAALPTVRKSRSRDTVSPPESSFEFVPERIKAESWMQFQIKL